MSLLQRYSGTRVNADVAEEQSTCVRKGWRVYASQRSVVDLDCAMQYRFIYIKQQDVPFLLRPRINLLIVFLPELDDFAAIAFARAASPKFRHCASLRLELLGPLFSRQTALLCLLVEFLRLRRRPTSF